MSRACNDGVGIVPGFFSEAKGRESLKLGSHNIFFPINCHKYNPNRKYMIAHDQFKVKNAPTLKFFAYFDNRGVCPRDQMKFRKCEILYFVEDGTIKVYEPPQRNSGLPQGCLINRNRIPKPDGSFYELADLNLGKHVILYGKYFKIIDCDPFTKKYLKEMGYRVGSPEPEIIDPVYADRQEMDMHRTSKQRPKNKVYKLAEFLRSHPKCLRFYAIYNNKPRHFDEIRYASLYYNLADKTIKIIDEKKLLEYKRQLSMGNYDTCLILKPTLVPKQMVGVNPLGKNSRPVILNLNAISRHKQLQELMSSRAGGLNNLVGFMRDSNPDRTAEESEEYYTAKDLDLGITLDIFGYEVYIYDCDEFTKEFYRDEFNKELIPVPLPEIKDVKYPTLIHKENFGNPEDSLQTCHQLASINMSKQLMDAYILSERPCHKGSRSDYLLKFFLNCRNGYDSKILTYLSVIITTNSILKEQYFVIRWFLEDDTVDIAGLDLNFTSDTAIGKYLKRTKLAKPKSEEENSGTCYYNIKDMFIGNVIYALKDPFLIIDADEYTLQYMEHKSDIFVHSNIKYIIDKLFPLIRGNAEVIKSTFKSYDLNDTGCIPYDKFKTVLMTFIPQDLRPKIPEQQIKTLARHFAREEYVGLKIEQLISIIQTELKKQRFEDFEKLDLLFRIFDFDNTNHKGHFSPQRVYEILRSYPLLIDRDLLKSFVFKFPQCEKLISYEEILKCLNYFENPVEPPDLTPYAININWERVESIKNLNKIAYLAFLKDLTNEKCPNCM